MIFVYHSMWVRGNGWKGFLLCGWMAAALCFSRLLSRLGWRGWRGVVAVLSAHGGPVLIDLHSFFYGLIALQGSLPDIRCETDVNIVFFLLFWKM